MQINPSVLTLDIKVQDKFRSMLANIANGSMTLSGVILGDSDIDYENSININDSRILNTPFNVDAIKYPLIYNGSGRGLYGYISCFARQVNSDGSISSLYQYPTNSTFTAGTTIPTLGDGYNFNSLTFSAAKLGYILFFQTILSNYEDSGTGLQERLNEQIDITVKFNGSTIVPLPWQVTIDGGTTQINIDGLPYTVYNNSMLIGKDLTDSVSANSNGQIIVSGELSNIKKTINFNI